MRLIENIGSFQKMDAAGYLVNECNFELIAPEWKEAVDQAKSAYLEHLPGQIHSIYLRGTIARGCGINGISDIDTFAVFSEGTLPPDSSWMRPTTRRLRKSFPIASGFEFHLLPLSKVLGAVGFLSHRFVIKNLSVCLYGENLAPRLPRYKPSMNIAWAFHGNIREVVRLASQNIGNSRSDHEVRHWCRWVGKRIVRTGFAIFMEEESCYTRDLFPAYEIFSKRFPEQRENMFKALEMAVNPISDRENLQNYLKNFGEWLADQAQRRFASKK